MTNKTGIEKMVGWLEDQKTYWNGTFGGTRTIMIEDSLSKAVALRDEERKQGEGLKMDLLAFCELTLSEMHPKTAWERKYAPVIKIFKGRVKGILESHTAKDGE